jgi:hypothetical protein
VQRPANTVDENLRIQCIIAQGVMRCLSRKVTFAQVRSAQRARGFVQCSAKYAEGALVEASSTFVLLKCAWYRRTC